MVQKRGACENVEGECGECGRCELWDAGASGRPGWACRGIGMRARCAYEGGGRWAHLLLLLLLLLCLLLLLACPPAACVVGSEWAGLPGARVVNQLW